MVSIEGFTTGNLGSLDSVKLKCIAGGCGVLLCCDEM